MSFRALSFLAVLSLAAACGGSANQIPGTKIERTSANESLVERLETYRLAVERKDAAALLVMASKAYWDDAGTPSGTDDFGYAGLKQLLIGRFQQVDAIRYSMKYVNIRHRGPRAFVDVMIDASFSLKDRNGQEVRQDMRDQNQMVLEWTGETWQFLSGM
jgi:hypothetical protein